MRWTTEDLEKEFTEKLSKEKERFKTCTSKGCLPKIFKKPVKLEPHPVNSFPGYYNRITKDIVIFKYFPSAIDGVTPDNAVLLFDSMRRLQEPVSFELIGSNNHFSCQLVCQRKDRQIVTHAIETIYGHSYLKKTKDYLFIQYKNLLDKNNKNSKGLEFHFNDYYLGPPYYFPLQTPTRDFNVDILDSILHSFSKLASEELGFYQVLFCPTRNHDWSLLSRSLVGIALQREEYIDRKAFSETIYGLVTLTNKVPVGEKLHPVLGHTEQKVHAARVYEKTKDNKPFFAVSLRVGLFVSKGRSKTKLKEITNTIEKLLPGDRRLKYVDREDYYKAGVPEILHYYMFFNRVSLREGMLLTSKELSGLAHFPTQKTLDKDYSIERAKGKRPPPEFLTTRSGIHIGESEFREKIYSINLTDKDRAEHCHIIGVPGRGKSTLIGNCVLQDINRGTGVCLIEPHGELIDNVVVPRIPDEFMDKVIYFDPSRVPLSLNILEVKDKKEESVIANDVVSIFRRFSDSWGVQIDEILSFGVLAILGSKTGGHLGTLHKFLTDKDFRKSYLTTVEDEYVLQFWKEQFLGYPKSASTPVVRRLNHLLRNPVLRRIVTQHKNSIDFRKIMDEGKVLLINLPLGDIGQENAYILGSLIISRLQAAAFTRQDISQEQRKPFYLYIDEFQNFMCASVEECITGTRKYSVGLILAHHSMEQLLQRERKVADAVFQYPNIRICFRVGDEDSVNLSKGFAHFTADELKNLATGEAIARVGGSANDFELKTHFEGNTPEDVAKRKKELFITNTLAQYEVEPLQEEEISDQKSVATYNKKTANELWTQETKESSEDLKVGKDDYAPRRKKVIPKQTHELSTHEKKFLELLSTLNELLPVRDVYKELRFGADKGNKIKARLLEMGVISETEAHLGKAKRKAKLLTLTPLGYETLGLPTLPGKGGSLHQFLQKIIAEYAEAKGYKAAIEELMDEGNQVDVGLKKNGERIAVEISVATRTEQTINNIEAAIETGYDRVISLFTSYEILNETRDILPSRMPKKMLEKVTLELIGEYKNVL